MDQNISSKVRAIIHCPKEFKDQFQQSKCLIPISVGQPYHENDKFEALINFVNQSFQSCTIMVCDSLQRHTLSIQKDLEQDHLHQVANQKGNAWLERNKFIYGRLKIPLNIMRWDEWLFHQEYVKQREKIDAFYELSGAFQKSIHDLAHTFLKRMISKEVIKKSDYQKAFDACVEYIKEECSVIPLWVSENFAFELYPKERPHPAKIVFEHFIEPYHSNFQKWLKIQFEKERK